MYFCMAAFGLLLLLLIIVIMTIKYEYSKGLISLIFSMTSLASTGITLYLESCETDICCFKDMVTSPYYRGLN